VVSVIFALLCLCEIHDYVFVFLYKVVQIRPGQTVSCLHTNQSRSYLNHLVHLRSANLNRCLPARPHEKNVEPLNRFS
jgi:hypothetical protein